MSQQRDEVYKVNSYLINYCLTSLNRRSHRNEKPFIKDYLVTLFYYLGVGELAVGEQSATPLFDASIT
jgi:hypothetical protein